MKRVVVTNKNGDIIATAPHLGDDYSPTDGGPTFQIITPFRGQYVHVVEFPDIGNDPKELLSLHQTHRVRVMKGRAAELEKRKKSLTPQALIKISKKLGR